MKLFWALVGALTLTLAPVATASATISGTTTGGPGQQSAPTPRPVATAVLTSPTLDAAQHGFFWQIFAPQPVVPGVYLSALAGSRGSASSEGTRSDEQFFEISSTGDNDVPEAALRAYKRAARSMAQSDPGCRISWTLLAAIGRVESDHGRFGGSQLGSDGISRPAIVGPRLDGAGPFAAIRDTDRGRLDGDKTWDRAIGQMQFLPGTWSSVARDGDGDGVKNPGDIDDSALASAVYLCGAGNLSTDAGVARAAFRYNHSDYYVALVLAFTHGFETGAFVLPSPPPPPGQGNQAATVSQVADKAAADKTPKRTPETPEKTKASPAPSPSPTKTVVVKPRTPVTRPTTPRPAPTTPAASSTPPAPKPVEDDYNGPLQQTTTGFTLGGLTLALDARGGDPALDDWDGDGAVETLTEELTGLVGQKVNVHGSKLGTTITFIRFVGVVAY